MKKQEQLGMNPGTASHRLVKNILFDFIVKSGQNVCYHCSSPMDRDTFSIEHKTPWLDSATPVELYFNLTNIGFSHKKCNYSAARKNQPKHGNQTMYKSGCRCDLCIDGIKTVYKAGNRNRDNARKTRKQVLEK